MTSGKANGADGPTSKDGASKDGASKDGSPDDGGVAPAAAQALSYEQARDKLAAVVKRLEAGGLTLEQSLELWERGERLAAVCAEWLDGARARLAVAMAERDEPAAAQDDARETPF
ncbi:MAG: exodeoxyribonuclease VII small subunit [Streptosporangiaceae bacterium]